MKKRSIWLSLCALISAFTMTVGCGGQNATPNTSSSESSSASESTSESSSESTSESSSESTSESTSDSSSDSTSDSASDSSSDQPDYNENSKITITAPEGEVYSYNDQVRKYIEAGAGADVKDYYIKLQDSAYGVGVKWTYDGEQPANFLVEYSLNADMSDALSETVAGNKKRASLYNLYKSSNYYFRVSALDASGAVIDYQMGEFYTSSLGPRVMNIDSIVNVRDLGGFETENGKTLVQGIAYRGGALTPPTNTNAYDSIFLTQDGKRYMSEVLGIKGEMDFRNATEAGVTDGSVIPGATLTYMGAGGYNDIHTSSSQKKVYRNIFAYFADESNYPMYIHCTGGADRTGTVSFLLHALLGVAEWECIQDYEFTSFSFYGMRGAQSGDYAERFQQMLTGLKAYPGATFQEQVENYLLGIGVTAQEIATIKAIFYGEATGGEGGGEVVPDVPQTSKLAVTAPTGEVYPYFENAKNYLTAGAGVEVADYWVKTRNPQVPINVEWTYSGNDADSFLVEYSHNADFSESYSVTVDGAKQKTELYNLYRGATYKVRVTALDAQGNAIETQYGEFQTTSLGPRVMNIDGICNVRDLGGYQTSFGKTIVQGIAYRGGALTPPTNTTAYDSVSLTEEGKRYMSEVLGIKGELDLRNAGESGVEGDSVIPGATLTYITVSGYESIHTSTTYQRRYREIFNYLADENNYPLYFHCTGGADRTGTLAFVLQAFLGVSELECIQGYEFTTFSFYNTRSTQTGEYADNFQMMLDYFDTYAGDTLQEKVQNYLLYIGVTEAELYNIKAIFFGEPTKTVVYAPETFTKNVDGDLVLSYASGKVPSKLYLNGIETPFTRVKNQMTVLASQLPALPKNSTVSGKVVFEGNLEVEFSFYYDEVNVRTMDDYMAFGSDGTIVLTDNKVLLTGTAAVGYEYTACVRLQTTSVSKTDGGIRIFLGSYGFECRGGEMRPYTINSSGTMKEYARDMGMQLPNTLFDGGATLYLTISFVDDKPVITIKVETSNATYEHSYTFASRVANEIADADAKMNFWIRTDAITSVTLYNESAWAARA